MSRTNKKATDPRVIFETDLHSDCGLIAAAAWKYLTAHGVKAKILNIRYRPSEGHTIVVYASATRLATYDHDGSLIFTPEVTWDTPPVQFAKSWAKANGVRKRVTDGRWIE